MQKKILFCLLLFAAMRQLNAQPIQRWKVADLLQYAQQTDSALIINFWATWCGPCIEELPYFHSLAAKYKNQKVKLLLVSLDFADYYPQRIRAFANKRKFTADIVWLDEEKPDYFCPLVDKAWSGAMPATLFFYPKKGYRNFKEAQLKPGELELEILKMLK
jgi:thiol-disulfide isomerase/thioredoxin